MRSSPGILKKETDAIGLEVSLDCSDAMVGGFVEPMGSASDGLDLTAARAGTLLAVGHGVAH